MTADPSLLTVDGHDETAAGLGPIERWCDVARRTLEDEGVAGGTLDLIFVDPEPMAKLNREHLGSDRPTDVLAFPLDGPDRSSPGPGDPPAHLGDIVVCPSVAAAQAPEHCGDPEAELTLLIVHGVLHVLGHDHAEPSDTAAMQARERHHLARYGYRHPVPV
ncbi:MAG: rRNA maturation RNase YbeY [Acidimicrobiia bacterium]|nr:rRNA maturation RNase YbeY [Acidimicrobiia bacterium]